MNMPLSPRAHADAQAVTTLEKWEAEGGAPTDTAVRTADSDPDTLSEAELLLLQRLGAALVSEWNKLPTPLQRALYARAVGDEPGSDRPALKRNMARFLHDHKDRLATA